MGRPSPLTRTRTGEDLDLQGYATDKAADSSLGKKATAVAEDAAAGAAAGCIVGPWGCVIGGAAGAVYGAIDQFGGDVKNFLNPNSISEDDYARMRRKCVEGYNGGPRGELVPGVAPDQYGACRYASDGSLSGGDWPFPGTWNYVGNTGGGGYIADQNAYARWTGPLCPGLNGQMVPFGSCAPGSVPPPPPKPALKLASASSMAVLKALAAPAKPALLPTPPPPKPPVLIMPMTANASLSRAQQTAHSITAAAQSGDPVAQVAIGDIAAKAKAGDPVALAQASMLTAAAKLQIRQKYIGKYLHIVNLAPVVITGAAPTCGCRPH